MPSLPDFLLPEPIRGRWRFSLSRASLIRPWRRRSRAFLLRADSSERIWCGRYFLRRLGFCTPLVPDIEWNTFIDDADLYTILITYVCGSDAHQMREQGDMCSVLLSRLIYHTPDNDSSYYSSFNQEVEKSRSLISRVHSGNLVSVLSVTQYPLCCSRSHLTGDSAGCDHQHPTVRTAGIVLRLKLKFRNSLFIAKSYFTVSNFSFLLHTSSSCYSNPASGWQ